MEENKNESKISKNLIVKIIIACLAVGVIIAIIFIVRGCASNIGDGVGEFIDDKIIGSEGKVTTVSETEIKEVLEISELQTADYIYNSVVPVQLDDNNIAYYISYEGTITAGIDFSQISVEVDEDNKVIKVLVPTAAVQNTSVNAGTMQYIFVDDDYNEGSVTNTAYKKCKDDLAEKAAAATDLLEQATDNARAVVEALLEPWIGQVYPDYTLEIK